MPTDRWDYAMKPLIPGTRLYVEWMTHPADLKSFGRLLKVTHVAGDDTPEEWPPITRRDAEGLRGWLDRELGGSK